MKKNYRKPTVNTIVIPERTAYACNLHHEKHGGCPHYSNMVGHAVCKSQHNMAIAHARLGNCG